MYEHELDLNCIMNRKHRRTIVQFKISAHDLEMQGGQYSGKDRNGRVCKLCRRTIEDEFHFIFTCITYIDLR